MSTPLAATQVWMVSSPEGRIIGTSVCSPTRAIEDALWHCGSTTKDAMQRLLRVTEQGQTRILYETDDGFRVTVAWWW